MLECRLTLEKKKRFWGISFGINKTILSLCLSVCQSYFTVQLYSAEESKMQSVKEAMLIQCCHIMILRMSCFKPTMAQAGWKDFIFF